MMRTEIADGTYTSNMMFQDVIDDISGLDFWAYFNGTNAATNLVTEEALTPVGTPARTYGYTTITPATNYYAIPNCSDAATQTLLFVASLDESGGNFAPIFTAYPGAAGLFVGLGYNYIRVHASGFGAIANYNYTSMVGNYWGFYSVILESGAATPIRVKNWSTNLSASGGTASSSRTTLGGLLSIGQYSIATTGVFPAKLAFAARIKAVATDTQITAIKSVVEANIAQRGISVI